MFHLRRGHLNINHPSLGQISTSADICMEALVDKLKLLDYEKEFCKKK
jgi:hypothetical protein